MKWFMLFCLSFTLCSCGTVSGTHEAIDAVNTSVVALQESLPKQCKTVAINKQIEAIQKELVVAENKCNDEVSKVKADKVKWMTAFWGLLFVICMFLLRKVI